MKHYNFILFLILIPFVSVAQQKKLDSLKIEFSKAVKDTTKARLLSEIGIAAYYVNSELAKKHNDTLIEFSKGVSAKYLSQGYKMKGVFFLLASDYKNAEIWYTKALELAKKNNDKRGEAGFLSGLGDLNARSGNTDVAGRYPKSKTLFLFFSQHTTCCFLLQTVVDLCQVRYESSFCCNSQSFDIFPPPTHPMFQIDSGHLGQS